VATLQTEYARLENEQKNQAQNEEKAQKELRLAAIAAKHKIMLENRKIREEQEKLQMDIQKVEEDAKRKALVEENKRKFTAKQRALQEEEEKQKALFQAEEEAKKEAAKALADMRAAKVRSLQLEQTRIEAEQKAIKNQKKLQKRKNE